MSLKQLNFRQCNWDKPENCEVLAHIVANTPKLEKVYISGQTGEDGYIKITASHLKVTITRVKDDSNGEVEEIKDKEITVCSVSRKHTHNVEFDEEETMNVD